MMDSLEALIKNLEDTHADEIKEIYEVEKNGKEYIFEIKISRK